MHFEFYVLNADMNTGKIYSYNIFNNINLSERIERELRKYVRSPKNYKHDKYNGIKFEKTLYGFEAFCEELRSSIMWQEWARTEYEIAVTGYPVKESPKFEKWDCYAQALPNVPIIAREIIYQYKQQIKEEKKKKEAK